MKNLTPEEMTKRQETNKKIIKFGCLPIAIFCIIIYKFIPSNSEIKESNLLIGNTDSLIALIKKDELWKVQDVQFKDSVLKIAVRPEKDAPLNGYYFDKTYNLTKFDNILEVEIYKNKISDKYETTYGKITGRIDADFKEKFISKYDGNCKPLTDYIKTKMNDADSYENVNTSCNYIGNEQFEVIQQFRGNNAFGAKVLNKTTAIIDKNGNIISIK
jgi:hypothetical protein